MAVKADFISSCISINKAGNKSNTTASKPEDQRVKITTYLELKASRKQLVDDQEQLSQTLSHNYLYYSKKQSTDL